MKNGSERNKGKCSDTDFKVVNIEAHCGDVNLRWTRKGRKQETAPEGYPGDY